MAEYTSLKEKNKMDGLIRIFGNTPEGVQMAKLVCKSQMGQVTEEDKIRYTQTIEEDLGAIKAELEYGCIPPLEKPITAEQNEKLKLMIQQEGSEMGIPQPDIIKLLEQC